MCLLLYGKNGIYFKKKNYPLLISPLRFLNSHFFTAKELLSAHGIESFKLQKSKFDLFWDSEKKEECQMVTMFYYSEKTEPLDLKEWDCLKDFERFDLPWWFVNHAEKLIHL